MVFTDLSSFRWSFNGPEPSPRLVRWLLHLFPFDFDSWYKKGTKDCQADALSRLGIMKAGRVSSVHLDASTLGAYEKSSCDFAHSNVYTDARPLDKKSRNNRETTYASFDTATVAQEQLRDYFCKQVQERIKEGQHTLFKPSEDVVFQGVVQSHPDVDISKFLQQQVVHTAHNTQVAGHCSGHKMFYLQRQLFCWLCVSKKSY